MAVDIATADKYFSEQVLHNDAWVNADNDSKQRALNNAVNMLSRQYKNREIPDEAVFEQAIWLLKISEARKQAEQGVVSYSIDGISVSLSQIDRSISPNVIQILGRRVGRSVSGRLGYIVSNNVRKPSGGVR
ncbi:hypothetical protein [Bacillus andreraoultii]|uniref:hypothetical protein n=1 Tax=Bacillus andreraoultii TaxID=1499685 RepID=UPI00067E6ED5|nr:hypothetical protein [Bacillus andreraoultii]